MSTLIKPRTPAGSEPSRDEDLTGVRALLSSLPEPEPMPRHVVDRINASLAAEQAERAAGTSGTSVTPLLSRARRRPARLLFAAAGAAAAVALVAVVGSNLPGVGQTPSTRVVGAGPSKAAPTSAAEQDNQFSNPAVPAAPTAPAAGDGAAEAAGGTGPGVVQLRLSETRYTRATFAKQARSLELAQRLRRPSLTQPNTTSGTSSKLEPAGTTAGLSGCLRAIGADRAQVVRADVSTYEGKPAVVIVATTNGKTVAYAVGRQCGPTGAFLLHPATTIPLP